MKKLNIIASLRAAVGTLALAALAFTSVPAEATTIITGQQTQPNTILYDVEALTSTYTNSTTSATDVTGLTVTVPATLGTSAYQYVEVCWNAQAVKSTAGSGTVSVVVNGVTQTISSRTTTSAAAGSALAACHYVQRPTDGAFVVKLQGVSSDTNLFTVSQGILAVRVFFTLA